MTNLADRSIRNHFGNEICLSRRLLHRPNRLVDLERLAVSRSEQAPTIGVTFHKSQTGDQLGKLGVILGPKFLHLFLRQFSDRPILWPVRDRDTFRVNKKQELFSAFCR